MIIHNLKICREFADAVWEGRKTAEIRPAGRFKTGQRVVFQAVENLVEIEHPINKETYSISYILEDPYIAERHVALCIKKVR